MLFERKFELPITLETKKFVKDDFGKIKIYSIKILKSSVMIFTGKIRGKNKIDIKFVSVLASNEDIEKFKALSVSDVKNIIYNAVRNRSIYL